MPKSLQGIVMGFLVLLVVLSQGTAQPLHAVQVWVDELPQAETDSAGQTVVELSEGLHLFRLAKAGYAPWQAGITVEQKDRRLQLWMKPT